MTTTIQTATPSKPRLYTGYALSTLVILFLVMDACFKFTTNPQVVETQKQLGFPMSLTPGIGVLALICTALYAIPVTSVLGALLLTGYLGGAIALHLRVDNPLFSHILFPVYIALFIWGGLWLRNRTLREVFPIASPAQPTASKKLLWTGYVITAISALLILLTAVMKFTYHPKAGDPPPMYPLHHIPHLAYLEIICIALYLIPATSFSGAVLMTGYLGGAACINLLGGPIGPALIPVLIGVLLWAGVWLRDARLRELFPLRSPGTRG